MGYKDAEAVIEIVDFEGAQYIAFRLAGVYQHIPAPSTSMFIAQSLTAQQIPWKSTTAVGDMHGFGFNLTELNRKLDELGVKLNDLHGKVDALGAMVDQ